MKILVEKYVGRLYAQMPRNQKCGNLLRRGIFWVKDSPMNLFPNALQLSLLTLEGDIL